MKQKVIYAFTFFALMAAFTYLFALAISCNSNDSETTWHELRYSPDKKDSVVYVHYVDDSRTVTDFYINYLLFNSLFNNNGGYNSVYQNYNNTSDHYEPHIYNNYRPLSNSSSNYTTHNTNYTSPVRNSSSPVRSRGYSSPVRSTSSPARTSSPIRSASSPARGR